MRASSHVNVPWWWIFILSVLCGPEVLTSHCQKPHLLPLGCIVLSQPCLLLLRPEVFGQYCHLYLIWSSLSGGLTHSPNSHQEAYSEEWTLVVANELLCTLCYNGQSPSVILKMFEPLTISVSHSLSIFVYAFSKLWAASKMLEKFFCRTSKNILHLCQIFFPK